jgi:putative transposase
VSQFKEERSKDISNACHVLKTIRSSLSYFSVKNDEDIEKRLTQLSQSHPTEGFWKFFNRLRNSGETVNHKRLHRVYKQMGLSIRRKVKRRIPARIKKYLEVPESFTHTWSIVYNPR